MVDDDDDDETRSSSTFPISHEQYNFILIHLYIYNNNIICMKILFSYTRRTCYLICIAEPIEEKEANCDFLNKNPSQ